MAPAPLLLRGKRFDAAHPAVMGIVNVNTDSFYEPARKPDTDSALARIAQLVAEGADIVDVGAVRAGQVGEWVDAETELARVQPVVAAIRIRFPKVLISVDTWRAQVASAVADSIDIINDTWAGAEPELASVAGRNGLGYVVSHTGGLPPRTDPVGINYGPDPDAVVEDVLRVLAAGADKALAAGVPSERILVDPTLDFGKTTLNSLRLVAQTQRVVELGYPVLMAISRKDFIGETLDLPIEERLEGTLAATAISAFLGATVFRAHDVRATRRVVDMVASIRGDRPPVRTDRGR